MRLIKYRAYCVDHKKMGNVSNISFHKDGTVCDIHICFSDGSNYFDHPLDAKSTCAPSPGSLILLEFTGLLDKNGKEIYEGDIIKYYYICGDEDEFKSLPVRFGEHNVEGFHHCLGFWLGEQDSWPYDFQMEIIGNIYENQELLK